MKMMILMCLLFSIVFTVLSGFYQRPGNEIVIWGECTQKDFISCVHVKKAAGFPFAFVYDNVRTSIPGHVGIEDDFRLYPFLVNILFYLVGLVSFFITLTLESYISKMHSFLNSQQQLKNK